MLIAPLPRIRLTLNPNACRDDDYERSANCFAREFVHLTEDNHKRHGHRRDHVRRLHRRLPTQEGAAAKPSKVLEVMRFDDLVLGNRAERKASL
jgi:hypothetical protein